MADICQEVAQREGWEMGSTFRTPFIGAIWLILPSWMAS